MKPLLANAASTQYLGNPLSDVESLKPRAAQSNRLMAIIKCAGPGLMLGLANSNAGDLLAAAQSGAKYRYLYMTWVTMLIPPLYLSTELVTRICVVTNKPLLVLVHEACGTFWAVIAILVLAVSCMGGLVMQICTVVAVGSMWGVGGVPVCLFITAVFVSTVLTDSVSKMEKIGICFGLFECAFCVSAWLANPSPVLMAEAFTKFGATLQLGHATITGAIIGAVLMPWMFFYQGSSVNKNKITTSQLEHERIDIAMGTFASQATMAGTLVTFAVAMGGLSRVDLDTISFAEIPVFLNSSLPHAHFLFSMGMVGASFVASMAIALTISWAFEEAIGLGLLGKVPEELAAMSSKVGFTVAVLMSCMLSLTGIQAISMIIFCDVVNSLTVGLVILFILFLSESLLPKEYAIVGVRKTVTFTLLLSMGICGFFSALCHIHSIYVGDDSDTEEATNLLTIKNQWRYAIMKGSGIEHFTAKPALFLFLALPMVVMQFALVGAAKKYGKTCE